MTSMTDTKDINPVYVDGEPHLSGRGARLPRAEEVGPRYVDNEPLCHPSCPSCTAHAGGLLYSCKAGDSNAVWLGTYCVPALRRDRDRLRARKDDPARVEQVAIVLLDNFGDLGDFCWEKLDEEVREEWREQARDVLAAADWEE
jgi:hypothetical protein